MLLREVSVSSPPKGHPANDHDLEAVCTYCGHEKGNKTVCCGEAHFEMQPKDSDDTIDYSNLKDVDTKVMEQNMPTSNLAMKSIPSLISKKEAKSKKIKVDLKKVVSKVSLRDLVEQKHMDDVIIKTSKGYVMGINTNHQTIVFHATGARAKRFKDKQRARMFVDDHKDAGYGDFPNPEFLPADGIHPKV